MSFNGRDPADDESRLEITWLDDEPSINLNDCRGGVRPPLFQHALPYGEPHNSMAMLTIAEKREKRDTFPPNQPRNPRDPIDSRHPRDTRIFRKSHGIIAIPR